MLVWMQIIVIIITLFSRVFSTSEPEFLIFVAGWIFDFKKVKAEREEIKSFDESMWQKRLSDVTMTTSFSSSVSLFHVINNITYVFLKQKKHLNEHNRSFKWWKIPLKILPVTCSSRLQRNASKTGNWAVQRAAVCEEVLMPTLKTLQKKSNSNNNMYIILSIRNQCCPLRYMDTCERQGRKEQCCLCCCCCSCCCRCPSIVQKICKPGNILSLFVVDCRPKCIRFPSFE